MPWYLRKSLKFGPIRFNLSKSGIGASVGVKGLRIGSGPKGKYIHAGREGVYFRQSLSSPETAATSDRRARTDVIENSIDRTAREKGPPKDWLARTLRRVFFGH